MRQKADTHQPDIISNVIKMPEAKGQQAAKFVSKTLILLTGKPESSIFWPKK